MAGKNRDQALYGRRDVLQLGAAGAAAIGGLGIAKRASAGPPTCTQSPSQTAGPYWVDEMLNRADIRSDPESGVIEQGLLLRLAINVSEITAGTCGPVAGTYVDVWHCNALGIYSDVSQQNTLGKKFLRGYQVSDAHGNVRFLTIYPGWYPGRTAHIHFRIRKFNGPNVIFNFVSQLYFDDMITDGVYARVAPYNTRGNRTTRNNNDGIFRSALLIRLADNMTHSVASFNAVINAVNGIATLNGLPLDEEGIEHANDFGGGTPPLHLA